MKLKRIILSACALLLFAFVCLISFAYLEYQQRELNQKLWDSCHQNRGLQALYYLSKGAEVDYRNERWSNGTPLHAAARGMGNELTSLLLHFGADPNAEDENGNTPLFNVMDKNIAFTLVASGADLNWKNNDGPMFVLLPIPDLTGSFLAHPLDFNYLVLVNFCWNSLRMHSESSSKEVNGFTGYQFFLCMRWTWPWK